MKALSQLFFARDSREVGYDLVGKLLVRDYKGKVLEGIISQVDAYSMRSANQNNRNAGAFYAPGAIHMYPSQGKYLLAVSTLKKDVYNEVLIRGVVPTEGVEIMKKLRSVEDEKALANGPGKVVQTFAIDRDFDGAFITDSSTGLWITNSNLKDIHVHREREVENGDESEDFVGRYTLNI